MKAEWTINTLGDTCEMYQPKTISSKEMVQDGAYPVFGANGMIGRYDQYNHEEPQLLITCRGATCGSVNISEPFSWITGNAMVVRPKQVELDMRFLEYLFRGGIDISQAITGAAQPQITRTNLSPLKISYPTSIIEQQRIVAILDEAFDAIAAARANAEQNRQNARALFESYLQSVFSQRGEGWVEKSLDDIGTTQTGSTPKSSEQSSYGDFMPFVKPGDFNSDGSLNYKNDGLSEAGAANARKVKAGSALMVCIGATIGKAGFCDRIIATNQQINAFTPNEFVSYKFIYYQMLTGSFKQRVIHASGQATLPIINKSKWSALTVAVPPTLDEQHKVVERLDALRNETQRLESLYLRKIAALDELKQSLLQQAFSGQLDTTRLEKLPV
ncbi:restriction endonuclease subunit S [Aeromonas rivipollensis]|uniref:restriction endonuclease subunit S n=1 Tax=Aeromonas rivipollensis TaxID=948519 RepID=UPI0038CFF274